MMTTIVQNTRIIVKSLSVSDYFMFRLKPKYEYIKCVCMYAIDLTYILYIVQFTMYNICIMYNVQCNVYFFIQFDAIGWEQIYRRCRLLQHNQGSHERRQHFRINI